MEFIDRAHVRKERAIRNEKNAFVTPTINSQDDIKRVIDTLSPNHKDNIKSTPSTVSTTMQVTNKDGRRINQQVSAKVSSQSHRDMILEALGIIKKRKEAQNELDLNGGEVLVNGKPMKSPPLLNTDSNLPVDPIIERITGGYREEDVICWDLEGFQYRYNIFEHRLARVKHARNE
jgi:hypothetical protein